MCQIVNQAVLSIYPKKIDSCYATLTSFNS